MAWYTPLFQEVGEEVDTPPIIKKQCRASMLFSPRKKYEL